MSGIIIAGGKGTRMLPITSYLNKHLIPLAEKVNGKVEAIPMILYPLRLLVKAGIKEIAFVTGKEHMGATMSLLGSGSEYGCHLTYRVQDSAGGIAEALGIVEDFAHFDNVAVILGDNIFLDCLGLSDHIKNFKKGAKVFLKEVKDPERFGVAKVENDRVVEIIEKPEKPVSNYAVTGLYLYDNKIWDIIRNIDYSDRGEKEITACNVAYIDKGELQFCIIDGFWSDAGTWSSFFRTQKMILGDDK